MDCNIWLADDHVLMRHGLKKILLEKGNFNVVGEADDGLQLLRLLNHGVKEPAVVILDLSMPNLGGIETIYEIKKINLRIKILVLTMHTEREYFYKTASAGAKGYLLKENADKELFVAIDRILKGEIYISPTFPENLASDWRQAYMGKVKHSDEGEKLTTREREILKLIIEGRISKEIAEMLFISVRTVENHRANMMRKTDAKTTAELVKYAIDKGYIQQQLF